MFRTPFSIGCVEQAYSQGLVLPFAAIRNQAGDYVLPSTQTITAAAAQKPVITPADFSIVNQPGASSYPVSGYSWALIYTHQPNQATGQALVTMLSWLTHDGQAYAAANLYVPLPAQVRQLARTMLQQVTARRSWSPADRGLHARHAAAPGDQAARRWAIRRPRLLIATAAENT